MPAECNKNLYIGEIYRSRFGYKPGSTWTTDPLFMKIGSDYYFYQNDHLGTPQKLTAINGAVVWAAKYTSFGKATVGGSSTITNNLRFPGQLYDEETGLHYNWFRYYDPEVGRYFRPDPIGFWGGDTNLYYYVRNNPLGLIDPWDLTPCDEKICIDKCLRDNYGGLYDVMKGLSIYGAFSSALSFTGTVGLDVLTHSSDMVSKYAISKADKIIGTPISKFGDFGLLKRSYHANKYMSRGAAFARGAKLAGFLGKVSAVVTVGATAFTTTAYIYCKVDCK